MSPDWLAVGGAAAGLAVVELDAASAGQFMLSRPIVIGPVLGLLFGDPALGTALGAIFELFHLHELPVGGHLPVNAGVAAGAATLLAVGPAALAAELAFPAGLLAGWGHRRLEAALRAARAGLGGEADRRAAAGEEPRLGRALGLQLARQAGATFGLLLAALAAGPALAWAWEQAPGSLRAGLQAGFALSPWIGAGALLAAARAV